jgi:hypothetical protein
MKREDFFKLLEKNENILIVFITSTDCKPCTMIKPFLQSKLEEFNVPCIYIDRYGDADAFSALFSKRQFKGTPSFLAYKKDNVSLIANLSISGTNEHEINAFFDSLDFL